MLAKVKIYLANRFCNKILPSSAYIWSAHINLTDRQTDGRTDGHHTVALPAPCNSMLQVESQVESYQSTAG